MQRELVRTAGRYPFHQPQREQTEPAKPLAVFVLDTNDNTLTMPIKYVLVSLRLVRVPILSANPPKTFDKSPTRSVKGSFESGYEGCRRSRRDLDRRRLYSRNNRDAGRDGSGRLGRGLGIIELNHIRYFLGRHLFFLLHHYLLEGSSFIIKETMLHLGVRIW